MLRLDEILRSDGKDAAHAEFVAQAPAPPPNNQPQAPLTAGINDRGGRNNRGRGRGRGRGGGRNDKNNHDNHTATANYQPQQ